MAPMSFSFRKRLKLFPHPKAPRLGDRSLFGELVELCGRHFY
jgi:hypothetical protein